MIDRDQPKYPGDDTHRLPNALCEATAKSMLEAELSDEDRSLRQYLSAFDDRLQPVGDPIMPRLLGELEQKRRSRLRLPARRWLYAGAAAAVVLLMAYSTHRAYANYRFQEAFEKIRSVVSELGPLGRFQTGPLIPPKQEKSIQSAKERISEFYSRYPLETLSDEDRTVMLLNEALVLQLDGSSKEALTILPPACEDAKQEETRRAIAAFANQELGNWDEAAEHWRYLFKRAAVPEESRTIFLSFFVGSLCNSDQHREASLFIDELIAAVEGEVYQAGKHSLKQAYAFKRLSIDYCYQASIIEHTGGPPLSEFEVLEKALTAIGRAMRITTKLQDKQFDVDSDNFRSANTSTDFLGQYLTVLQRLTYRFYELKGEEVGSYPERIEQVEKLLASKPRWDSLELLRSHYAWQVRYQVLKKEHKKIIEYAIKCVEAEDQLLKIVAKKRLSSTIVGALKGAIAAAALEDHENQLRMLEFLIQNASRETINNLATETAIEPYAMFINNVAYLYAVRAESTDEQLLRAYRLANEALGLAPGHAGFLDTLEVVKERLTSEGLRVN